MIAKWIAAIAAPAEDLPGQADEITDAVAEWQDEDLSGAELREMRADAEERIRAAIGDLSVTVNLLRAAMVNL